MDFTLQKNRTIIVNMGKEIKQIEIDKITHIKCDTYLSTIFYEGGTHDTCVKNLKTFENELLEFDFIRVNHNSIINLKYLDYIKKGSKKIIVLSCKIEIQISRRKWATVKNMIQT